MKLPRVKAASFERLVGYANSEAVSGEKRHEQKQKKRSKKQPCLDEHHTGFAAMPCGRTALEHVCVRLSSSSIRKTRVADAMVTFVATRSERSRHYHAYAIVNTAPIFSFDEPSLWAWISSLKMKSPHRSICQKIYRSSILISVLLHPWQLSHLFCKSRCGNQFRRSPSL